MSVLGTFVRHEVGADRTPPRPPGLLAVHALDGAGSFRLRLQATHVGRATNSVFWALGITIHQGI